MNATRLCVTCGVEFADPPSPPLCPICEDDRQSRAGRQQQWTSAEALRTEHRNVVRSVAPGLTSIKTEPGFAIGQQAILAEAPSGNILWDSVYQVTRRAMVMQRGGA